MDLLIRPLLAAGVAVLAIAPLRAAHEEVLTFERNLVRLKTDRSDSSGNRWEAFDESTPQRASARTVLSRLYGPIVSTGARGQLSSTAIP